MISYRVIPVLLLSEGGLVKTEKFKKPTYVGDPINAIRIFNDKEVDELVFLDIDASKENRGPDFKLLKQIASECFMPLGYGGGITSLDEVKRIFSIGIEKVILNSIVFDKPQLVDETAAEAGNQSVVVSIDYKKALFGKTKVYSHAKRKTPNQSVVQFAKEMEERGAGEIILNCVDQDGLMNGYDLDMLAAISEELTVPVVACGGAGNINHLSEAVKKGKASAVAAGSMFVFHGPHKAVLINYPSQEKLSTIFN
ncbi:MAG: AglZ/HisF2 family acetamidino modification protein [Bacteroidetes bacterium]|nr:AglZ/HisF2 family acetamidino modification protein [Bacteroidota bacterium]